VIARDAMESYIEVLFEDGDEVPESEAARIPPPRAYPSRRDLKDSGEKIPHVDW